MLSKEELAEIADAGEPQRYTGFGMRGLKEDRKNLLHLFSSSTPLDMARRLSDERAAKLSKQAAKDDAQDAPVAVPS